MESTLELQRVKDKIQQKLCLKCQKELSKKQTKFCSLSCNASYHNAKKRGRDARNWRNGRSVNSEGYVRIHMPGHPNACDGYVYEHRYVMELKIGRLLTSEEIVHHLNGIKDDNRIENLALFDNQSNHCRTHNELRNK